MRSVYRRYGERDVRMVVEIIMGSIARKGDDGAAASWLQASNALQARSFVP